MGFLEELEEEEAITGIPRSTLAKLHQMEDELLQQSAQITAGVMGFVDVDPSQEEPSEEFREKYGEDADKMFKLARFGYVSKRNAPIGIEIARQVYVGISRNRAQAKGLPSQLNLHVYMPEPVLGGQQPQLLLAEGVEVED